MYERELGRVVGSFVKQEDERSTDFNLAFARSNSLSSHGHDMFQPRRLVGYNLTVKVNSRLSPHTYMRPGSTRFGFPLNTIEIEIERVL